MYELRYKAFARATEFELLDPTTLEWSQRDEDGVVLVASDDNGLVSTMRGELVHDAKQMGPATECDNVLPDSSFPSLLLSKAATRPGEGNGGLHSALRYHFLRAAIAADIASLAGVVFDGAPRTRLIESIGYELVPMPDWWYTDVEPRRATLIAHLARARMPAALDALGASAQVALATFPWRGAPMSFGS